VREEALRAEIQRRLAAIRKEVAEYFDAAHPSLAAAREPIEGALDDTRMLLAAGAADDPFWPALAAQQLASAEAQFINAKALILQHGGPQRSRDGGMEPTD
jgi:hypothetical protein